MTLDCRTQIEAWVNRRYFGMQPHQRKLIRKVLELRFCEGPSADEHLWELEAYGFRAFYLRRYRAVRDAVKEMVGDGVAAREVKNGLLVYRWLADPSRADRDPEDFETLLEADLRRLQGRIGEALAASVATPPFEDFPVYLESYLWARVFDKGHARTAAELAQIATREVGRIPSWEREVGTIIESSVRGRFASVPVGLTDNLRKTLWKYDPADDRQQLLADSLDLAEALNTEPPAWEKVKAIVNQRITGQIRSLVKDYPHIDVDDVLQEAWSKVVGHYDLEPARAPELFGLIAVTARRVVLDHLRRRPTPGPGPSTPEKPDLRTLAYELCPPHQSLAWTWIEVFGKAPRMAANLCCHKTLQQNRDLATELFQNRGYSWLNFLAPLDRKLGTRVGAIGLNPTTCRIYQHLLELQCGKTHPWHYLTGGLPDNIADRIPALEARSDNLKVRGLERQMPHWAQTVNRVWRPAAIEHVFFARQTHTRR